MADYTYRVHCLLDESNLRYEERRRLYYERYWARVDRRTWRRDTARKLTRPLAADGSAYRRRCLARKRRSR